MAARSVAAIKGSEGGRNGMFQWATVTVVAIPAIKAMSPIRFVRAVIMPPARVEGVW